MTARPVSGHSYASLADGTTPEIRPAEVSDTAAVLRFHQARPPQNLHFRFFSPSKRSAETEARRVCRPPDGRHAALLALLGERVAWGSQLRAHAAARVGGDRVRGRRPSHNPTDRPIRER